MMRFGNSFRLFFLACSLFVFLSFFAYSVSLEYNGSGSKEYFAKAAAIDNYSQSVFGAPASDISSLFLSSDDVLNPATYTELSLEDDYNKYLRSSEGKKIMLEHFDFITFKHEDDKSLLPFDETDMVKLKAVINDESVSILRKKVNSAIAEMASLRSEATIFEPVKCAFYYNAVQSYEIYSIALRAASPLEEIPLPSDAESSYSALILYRAALSLKSALLKTEAESLFISNLPAVRKLIEESVVDKWVVDAVSLFEKLPAFRRKAYAKCLSFLLDNRFPVNDFSYMSFDDFDDLSSIFYETARKYLKIVEENLLRINSDFEAERKVLNDIFEQAASLFSSADKSNSPSYNCFSWIADLSINIDQDKEKESRDILRVVSSDFKSKTSSLYRYFQLYEQQGRLSRVDLAYKELFDSMEKLQWEDGGYDKIKSALSDLNVPVEDRFLVESSLKGGSATSIYSSLTGRKIDDGANNSLSNLEKTSSFKFDISIGVNLFGYTFSKKSSENNNESIPIRLMLTGDVSLSVLHDSGVFAAIGFEPGGDFSTKNNSTIDFDNFDNAKFVCPMYVTLGYLGARDYTYLSSGYVRHGVMLSFHYLFSGDDYILIASYLLNHLVSTLHVGFGTIRRSGSNYACLLFSYKVEIL